MRRGIGGLVATEWMDADDPQLLLRAADDADAFAHFYRATVNGVLRYFESRVLDCEIAADLAAETYAQLLAGLHRYSPDKGNPTNYLYGIARHQLAGFHRAARTGERYRRRLRMAVMLEWDGGIDDIAEDLDLQASGPRLAAGLEQLSKSLRDAVVLRVIRQLPYGEVASRLGCSEGAARVRVSRGLSILYDTASAWDGRER